MRDNHDIWGKYISERIVTGRIKARDYSVFCRQFAAFWAAGIGLVPTLEMLESETENSLLRRAVGRVRADVKAGETLAESMRRQRGVFPSMFVNLIRAGEETGRLGLSAERLAVYFERTAKLSGMARKAMIYPTILLATAVSVIAVTLIWLVPMYSEILGALDAGLPVATRILLRASEFAVSRWRLILTVLVVAIVGICVYARTESGSRVCGRIVLAIPVLGTYVKKSACASAARNLATVLGAGIPLREALAFAAETMDNAVYRDAWTAVRERVSCGARLAEAMQESSLFLPFLCHMTAAGEETGRLEEMFGRAADYYEEEARQLAENAAALMEPAITIVMALTVLAVIMAVFSPLMEMYSSLEFY